MIRVNSPDAKSKPRKISKWTDITAAPEAACIDLVVLAEEVEEGAEGAEEEEEEEAAVALEVEFESMLSIGYVARQGTS